MNIINKKLEDTAKIILGLKDKKELKLTYNENISNSSEFNWFLNNFMLNPIFDDMDFNQKYDFVFNDDNTICSVFLSNVQLKEMINYIESILTNDEKQLIVFNIYNKLLKLKER